MPVPGLGQEKSLRRISKEILGEIAASDYDDELNAIETSTPLSLEAKSTPEIMTIAIDDGRAPNLNQAAPHGMDEFSGYENDASTGIKIICNTIYNSMGTQEWYDNRVLWNKHLNNYLTPYHQVGYYKIFKPFTNLMSKNKLIFRLGKYMAKCRTRDIKAVMTDQRRYLPGMIIRYIFEPISFAIGYTITKVKG